MRAPSMPLKILLDGPSASRALLTRLHFAAQMPLSCSSRDLVNDLTPPQVARLLKFLSDLPEPQIRAIASRSYQHPLGFYKLILAQSSDTGEKLRLHVWRNQAPIDRRVEDIHDHFWDFRSLVLIGHLRSEIYEECFVSSTGTVACHAADLLPGDNGQFWIQRRGTACVRKVRTVSCESFQSHSLTQGQLHRVIVTPDRMTATLVLQGPRIAGRNRVFRSQQSGTTLDSAGTSSVKYLTSPMTRRIFNDIQSSISQAVDVGTCRSSSHATADIPRRHAAG